MAIFQFANVVVVDDNKIGCIVKTWADDTYDVYVRTYNSVRLYASNDIQHYVYNKELSDDELEFYY